jgi:hypothetical protein
MTPKLNADQRHALTRHHILFRNTWKNALRSLWAANCENPPLFLRPSDPDFALLFDLRDSHGDRWLRDASITAIKINPLPRNAARALAEMRKAPVLTSTNDVDGLTVWRRIDVRRVRDKLSDHIDRQWWGGVLSSLRNRDLYRADALRDRHTKHAGYGWVRALQSLQSLQSLQPPGRR